MRKNTKKSNQIGGRTFPIVNGIFMIGIMLITVYPIYFSFINSLNSGEELVKGYSYLWPAKFTFASWNTVLADAEILKALFITFSRTFIVTFLSLLITAMFSYAFSRPYLAQKRFFVVIGFISMYFNGGIISTFIVYHWLGLYDTYLVYILPFLFSGFYNVIIFNANFKGIPDSLFEAAKIDGASEFKIFMQIVMPLSKPVLAALGVFTACGVWNDYGTTLFFTQSANLQTLANYTLKVVKSSQAAEQLKSVAMQANSQVADLVNAAQGTGAITAQTVELSAMILTAIPMIIMYPFVQKFFAKGVMVGSVKG